MKRTKHLIGLDLGTTAVKGILVRVDGKPVCSAGCEYALDYPAADRCELDPEVYFRSARSVLRTLVRQGEIAPEQVLAISFSSQGETLIQVDGKGKPIRKAIVWLDNRSAEEAAEIKSRFDPETLLHKTGQPEIVPLWPATRVLWLRKHEPRTFDRAAKYLLVQDYVVHRLTGRFVTDQSMVSSTLYYDIVNKRWWPEMLDFLELRPDRLPEVVPSGTPVGPLTPEAAKATGLPENIVVAAGAYDHPAGAIGCGNIHEGVVSETTGASMAICVTLDRPKFEASLRLPCQIHAVPGKYFLLPYGQTAGLVLKWFKEQFGGEEVRRAKRTGQDPYDLLMTLAGRVPPGADGLVMLPHLMGTGSPEFNDRAKGALCGLTLQMGKGHVVRALIESVACIIRMNLEALAGAGIRVDEIRALGGGAKSDLWNQVKADLTGVPLSTFRIQEAASLGAAILAGVGSGVFEDLEEGCARTVRVRKTYTPNPEHAETYRTVFMRYKKLYQSLETYWQ